ncbi:MAG: hypothetical protein J7501_09455 [Bdellovibrio sp.]|nr:hypothetical protein [Bdellovibrio sp.]
MRAIQWVFITALLTSCATQSPKTLSSAHYTDEVFVQVPFVSHDENAPFKSYLAMNFSYPGFQALLKETEAREKVTLKNRGEAHITVITPPEFDKVLSKKISIQEINAIAAKMNLQGSHFHPLCVGKGKAKIKDQEQSTYFVVMDSENLFKIRKAIQELYISHGGKASDFNPDLFYPHVTLGYTDRDLHYEDGVVKDAASCIFTLEPGPHKK